MDIKILSKKEIQSIYGINYFDSVSYPDEIWPRDEVGLDAKQCQELIEYSKAQGIQVSVVKGDNYHYLSHIIVKNEEEDIKVLSKINVIYG